MRRIATGILTLVALIITVSQGWCSDEDQGWNAVGIRGGLSATSRRQFFHQYEAFASYGLPWSMRNDSGWGVALQANGALGALHAAEKTGFIGAVGPGLIFDKAGGKGVALEIGGDLNFLSQYNFGAVDLNGNVLFDGHVGVMYRFCGGPGGGGPGIGYRFQHMSNGGLNGKRNTGLDLHMLALSWHF
jgi:hypothetical protein